MPRATIKISNSDIHSAIKKYIADKYGVKVVSSTVFFTHDGFLGKIDMEGGEVIYELQEK